jgi:hypothetical protein
LQLTLLYHRRTPLSADILRTLRHDVERGHKDVVDDILDNALFWYRRNRGQNDGVGF